MQCPVCRKAELDVFFEADSIPVLCNELHATRAAALSAPKGDLVLGFCPECTLVHNVAFDETTIVYTQAYENSLHFSARFQEYAHGLADDLVARLDLVGRTVLEIGCGKGDFLHMLCDRGVSRAVGFDASFEGDATSPDGKIRVVREPFGPESSHAVGDLIACRHVLEHIPEPRDFLATVRAVAERSEGSRVYFEVPNALYTLRDLGIWDLIYEHCSYFTEISLARVFREAGFEVLRTAPAFGGQFLGLESRLTDGAPAPSTGPDRGGHDEIGALVRRFAGEYDDKRRAWERKLGDFRKRGRRVAIWGAGSKGVTFLNVVPGGAEVTLAVDINERKHGRYVPGTGQPVVSPADAVASGIDHVLVMNPMYRDEIDGMLRALGSEAEVESV